jgi:hypothetical protein
LHVSLHAQGSEKVISLKVRSLLEFITVTFSRFISNLFRAEMKEICCTKPWPRFVVKSSWVRDLVVPFVVFVSRISVETRVVRYVSYVSVTDTVEHCFTNTRAKRSEKQTNVTFSSQDFSRRDVRFFRPPVLELAFPVVRAIAQNV